MAVTAVDVLMPRLSDTMEQGTILRWLHSDGAEVREGVELVEIETDKASMTYESQAAGVLQIIVAEGETAAVGAAIARLCEGGAARAQRAAAGARETAVGAAAQRAASPSARDAPPPPADSKALAAQEAPAVPETAPPSANGNLGGLRGQGLRSTPLARRAALAHGVSLAQLVGTGPRGRIVHADVLGAAGLAPEPPRHREREKARPHAVDPQAPRSSAIRGEGRRVEPTRTQELIARRMAEAKATTPHFQVQTEVAMDAAIAFRAELRAVAEEPMPSLNDLIVKACALALRWHPRANASYLDGGFLEHDRVNVGVAVAGEETLVVPVVLDADTRSLGQIARETRRLAERVRTGEVTPPELSGATFTVSNLGMYGMTAIVPVINPGQAGILGVGAIRPTLAREHGEVVDRHLMTLTLSCDHRILYGADASLFLGDIRGLLESPLRLVL